MTAIKEKKEQLAYLQEVLAETKHVPEKTKTLVTRLLHRLEKAIADKDPKAERYKAEELEALIELFGLAEKQAEHEIATIKKEQIALGEKVDAHLQECLAFEKSLQEKVSETEVEHLQSKLRKTA